MTYQASEEIQILHFNDVYHISDLELVARFATIFLDPSHVTGSMTLQDTQQVRVFSGDIFSPSMESLVLRGDHMTDILNTLQIDVACYGNHDFEFGEERLSELSRRTNFPWTLSNLVRQPRLEGQQTLLALSRRYFIKEVSGYKIGFFGLAGTCQQFPSCHILDPSTIAKSIASHLRKVEGCHLVIALTHMRLVEDLKVSNATTSPTEKVDLLLGGHDHYVVRRSSKDIDVNPSHLDDTHQEQDAAIFDYEGGDVRIVKSGTNWRGLSVINLSVSKNFDGSATIKNVRLKQITNLKDMDNYHQIIPNPKALDVLSKVNARIGRLVRQPLFHTAVPLDGRSDTLRNRETNLGSMLADVVRAYFDTNIALVNSGAIRCDRMIPISLSDNPLRIQDVVDIFPFGDAMVVKRVTGSQLQAALENSASNAHTDGRFLQVSGLRFSIDWDALEYHRLSDIMYVPSLTVANSAKSSAPQALSHDTMYTVAMFDFVASGFNDFTSLRDAETVIDANGAMTDTTLLLEIFGGSMSDTSPVSARQVSLDEHNQGIGRARQAIIRDYLTTKIDDEEAKFPVVSPVVDGRIKCLTS